MMKIRSYKFNWICSDAHFWIFALLEQLQVQSPSTNIAFDLVGGTKSNTIVEFGSADLVWVPQWLPVYQYCVPHPRYLGHTESILRKVPLPTNRLPTRARSFRRTFLLVNAAFA